MKRCSIEFKQSISGGKCDRVNIDNKFANHDYNLHNFCFSGYNYDTTKLIIIIMFFLSEIIAEHKEFVSEQTTHIADHENDEVNLENPTSKDIAKYIKGFENVQCNLKDYIDPLNELPFCFVKYKIMTFEEANEIERSKPHTTREIVAKMAETVKRDQANCLPILKALIDNDQTHIAKFIVSSGNNTRSPDRVLTTEEKNAIDRNMFFLEKLVSTRVNDLLVLLVAEKCITPTHKDWIISYKKGEQRCLPIV